MIDGVSGHRYDHQKTDPLWAFGHGLSYTTFAYSGLAVSGSVSSSASATVTFTVTNSGKVCVCVAAAASLHRVAVVAFLPLLTPLSPFKLPRCSLCGVPHPAVSTRTPTVPSRCAHVTVLLLA